VRHLGFCLFLALTGFLVTAAVLRHHDEHGRAGLPRLWWRWFVRLSPPLLVTLAGGLLAGYALADAEQARHLPRAAAAALLLVADLDPGNVGGGPLGHLGAASAAARCCLVWSAATALVVTTVRGRARVAAVLMTAAGAGALTAAALWSAGIGGGAPVVPAPVAAFLAGAAVAAVPWPRPGGRRGPAARPPAGPRTLRLGPAVELGQVAAAYYPLHGVVLWSMRSANPGIHPVALVVVGGGLSWVAALFTHHGLARRAASRRRRPVIAASVFLAVAAVLVPAAVLLPRAAEERSPGDGRPLVLVAGDRGAADLVAALSARPPARFSVRAAAGPVPGVRPVAVVLHPGGATGRDPCAPAFRGAFAAELDHAVAEWGAAVPGVRVLVANLPPGAGGAPVAATRCVSDAVESYTAGRAGVGLLDVLSAVCPDERCPAGDPGRLAPPAAWFEGQITAALAR
jgi:peptidoglycan/LPS O-acetylase OafA/YrhL